MKLHTKLMTEPRRSTSGLELEEAGECFSETRKLICIDKTCCPVSGFDDLEPFCTKHLALTGWKAGLLAKAKEFKYCIMTQTQRICFLC